MKKKTRRQLQTAFLALFAAGSFAWSAIYIFDVPKITMLKLLLLSCMLVVLMMMAALIPAMIYYFIKHGVTKTSKKPLENQVSEPAEKP